MKSLLRRLGQEEEGQDLAEYALLLLLLVFAGVASMQVLASGIASLINSAASNVAITTS
jgi:Flp pilus assembly pilin Flp